MRSPNDVQSPWTQVARRVARLFPGARAFAALVVAAQAASAQHGRIVTDTVRSASLANLLGAPAETRVSTYLPPGYDASPLARFPDNQHGIIGYLNDKTVAKCIAEAL